MPSPRLPDPEFTADPARSPLRVAVLVASRGRPEVVGELLDALAGQTRRPDQLILSVTGPQDLPPSPFSLAIDVVCGTAGSCVQRNRGLDALREDIDLIAFFDDDYVPQRDALQNVGGFFLDHPDVVGANGALVADGIKGPGLSHAEAQALLARSLTTPKDRASRSPAEALYGCNMVFRRRAVGDLRFDEALALNGWQEDIDFSARVGLRGGLVKCAAFEGVHRGVKGARVSGVRFGYAQVVNPAYLARKRTMRSGYAVKIAAKNVMANLARSPWPEPWADRAGRLKGNLLGMRDLLQGRLDPRRIVEL